MCLYSMKIKKQTRKLAAGCSKYCFEVADGSRHGLKRFSKSIKYFFLVIG
ncbi:chlorohydrolase [Streptococcus oralis]|nr:chlorohydrolase [Streptococcus oralis]PLA07708.1 chlorohydrolase [Streptococcus oralis subsp. dentisani]